MSQAKWQPVVLVLDRRLECKCGTLAIFVSGKLANPTLTPHDDEYNVLHEVDVWCQDCFTKAQEEEEA